MLYDTPHILLVNPWIHDFAAYDYWAKPIGLLYIAAILRQHGMRIHYIDCLDRFHPSSHIKTKTLSDGRGAYQKTPLRKPMVISDVKRTFSRYGILPQWFEDDLSNLPEPDAILVTSSMTYWYPGVFETIAFLRRMFPKTPLVLGGIYASLCYDHAVSYSGASRVITGPGELHLPELFDFFDMASHKNDDLTDFNTSPYPAFDLQAHIPYVPLLTSKGCPFDCTYCASGFLNPSTELRNPEQVVAEIQHWHYRFAVNDFVFYDDALLLNSENHAALIFEGVLRAGLKVRFHTPNALHIREISSEIADLMYRVGFSTIRLGLETAVFSRRKHLDHKVNAAEFENAVTNLLSVGFNTSQIGAYLLVGLPEESLADVVESIERVKQLGILPILTYYTPIPHTAMWDKAVATSRYDLNSDPIFTNNAIFPCQKDPFSWETISYLKNLC